MPVATKNAVGLYHKEELLIGGGYTGSSRDDAIVHTYDPKFNIWNSLPPAPLKWSALASLGDKIVLIGGKEVGKPKASYSNKLAVLDEQRKEWKFLDPPMYTARMSPVVHAHDGYLIVAGGSKGSLDYNMEIFDLRARKWTVASPLPHKCLRNTSTTIDGVWYLLNEDSGLIHCADMATIIQYHVSGSSQRSTATSSQNTGMQRPPVPKRGVPPLLKVTSEELLVIPNHMIWRPLETQPPARPFRITTIEGHLLALSLAKGAVSAHAYMEGSWQYIGKLPFTVSTASVAIDSLGQLFLFGGVGGCGHYSNKLSKAFLVERTSKKSERHVALDTTAIIINSK
jgi:hypothetical protein